MHLTEDGNDVMLAVRFEANVAQDDHFVIGGGLLERRGKQRDRVVAVSGEELLIGADDTLGCPFQPLPIRIVAGPLDQRADGQFRLGLTAGGASSMRSGLSSPAGSRPPLYPCRTLSCGPRPASRGTWLL